MKNLFKVVCLLFGVAWMVHAATAPTTPLQGVNTNASTYTGQTTYTLVDQANVTASLVVSSITTTGSTNFISASVTGSLTQAGGVVTLSSTTFTGGAALYSVTLANLGTLTPSTTGQIVYCSTCVSTPVCISTGSVSPGAWVAVSVSTGNTAGFGSCK